jgi:predicted ester cyclase
MDAVDVIASGDKAVARVKASGTQNGEFMGLPPSGRRAEVQLIDIMRFDDTGLITEHWGVTDFLSMLQQLGAIPESPSDPPSPSGRDHERPEVPAH